MGFVSEIMLRYSAVGAEKAVRADAAVRKGVNQTADTARKQRGPIEQWMRANKVALGAIAGAVGGMLLALVASSPILGAELGRIRLGFGLLADSISTALLPAFQAIEDAIFTLVSVFDGLPEPVQQFIGLFIGIAGALAIAGGAFLVFSAAAATADVALLPLIGGLLFVAAAVAIVILVWQKFGPIAATIVAALLALAAAFIFLDASLFPLVATIIIIAAAVLLVIEVWNKFGAVAGIIIAVILALAIAFFVLDAAIFPIVAIIIIVIAIIALVILAIMNWGKIVDWLKKVWDGFVKFIKGAWDAIWGALKGIASSIANFFGGLIGGAVKWGEDMIKNIAKGIGNAIQWVKDAAGNVVDSIKHFLGFEVPANDAMAHRWGKDMGTHFGKGLKGSFANMSGLGIELLGGLGLNVSPTASPLLAAPTAAPPSFGGGGSNSTMHVHLTFEKGSVQNTGSGNAQLDEDRLVDKVVKKIGDKTSGRTTR